MRWTGGWLVPLTVVTIGLACSPEPAVDDDRPPRPPATSGNNDDGGGGGPADSGTANGDGGTAGMDGGTDGGTDGGMDGGVVDAGPPDPINFPTLSGWQFFGPQHGGPREVWSVDSDGAGNVWVAGGLDGLFVLTPGATEYKRFTAVDGLADCSEFKMKETCAVIAVEGGSGSTVFVGYDGAGEDSEQDPTWMQASGDADKVVFNGATITVSHFDIWSPPGMYDSYPNGREKLRTIHRIVFNPTTGDLWFGGNHGVAMLDADDDVIYEHHHVDINGYRLSEADDPNGDSYTMLSGDWRGLALDAAGDLWMGGGHRIGKLQYGTEGNDWWADITSEIDVWPDPKVKDARPEERVDDLVEDIVIGADGSVWVGSLNGLARVVPATGLPGTGVPSITYVPAANMADPKVTALERDPVDGALWIGHLWGGVTRIKGGQSTVFSWHELKQPLVDMTVRDIQSDVFNGQRRLFVSFSGGAVGIYTGP